MRTTPITPTAPRITRGAPCAVLLALATTLLAGCSGSSSGGTAAAPEGTAASSSPLPGATVPGVHGPNGDITAPASNPPSSTSPGGSTVFPKISARQRTPIDNHLVTMPGVRTVAWYPQFQQIEVYYKAGTTSSERQAVYDYIAAHDPAAAPSPRPTP
jgi:hypothetical protein